MKGHEPVSYSEEFPCPSQTDGDLYLVQRALGHRQITTTEIYARVSDDRLRRAIRFDI